jgi:uncharacterized protein
LKPTIIIAALSSRAYVQAAAAAGFEVIAIDAFCDVDTQKMAKKVLQVKVKNGHFETDSFYNALSQIDCENMLGLSIGAGFEACLDMLAAQSLNTIPAIYNAPAIISAVKNPHTFFAFCDSVNMYYPETQFAQPQKTIGWLQKRIGGSGGAHIRHVLPLDFPANSTIYYQKIQVGLPISCLFLSDGKNTQVIGFNEQFINPSETLPYRYAGAVSHIDLPETVKTQITHFVAEASQHFGLKGINSADFLLENETLYALEINPRLSATLDLYRAEKGDLFTAHVQACLGQPIDWPIVDKQSRAIYVVYANKTAQVPRDMDWPDWVCDIPQPDSEIAAGQPICTVLAQARTAKLAKKNLLQRTSEL